MLKVGMIDSGINRTTNKLTMQSKIAAEQDFTGKNIFIDKCGHGSAVCKVITSSSQCMFYSARVFHEKLVTNSMVVCQALQWLINQKVDLINMSFGLTSANLTLNDLCQQAITNKIILVAAAPAQGNGVYPANFNGVIRATGDARCHPNQISFLNSKQADLGGFTGDISSGIAGASIGCAWVSANIINRLSQLPNLTDKLRKKENILQLYQSSSDYYEPEYKRGDDDN